MTAVRRAILAGALAGLPVLAGSHATAEEAGARAFLVAGPVAEARRDRVSVVDVAEWRAFADVFNVEATTVAHGGSGLLFLWVERASGMQSTEIRWAKLTLEPFEIGPALGSATFALPDGLVDVERKPLYSRLVVGLDVDDAGRDFSVALDPEETVEDPDSGPFRGAAFMIGRMSGDGVELDTEPTLIGVFDGFKPESVASRTVGDSVETFVGTDDENYGGALRPLPGGWRPMRGVREGAAAPQPGSAEAA